MGASTAPLQLQSAMGHESVSQGLQSAMGHESLSQRLQNCSTWRRTPQPEAGLQMAAACYGELDCVCRLDD